MPSPSAIELVRARLLSSADTMRHSAEQIAPDLVRAAALVTEAFRSGGKLLLCGNGGSAAECQHISAELVNLLDRAHDRPGLSAIALTTDGALLSATANDRGYAEIFARQVEALGRPGDVLLALSTSGRSANVLRALTAARLGGLRTVLLTGSSADAFDAQADICLQVPSSDTQEIQEVHLALGHALCGLVEQTLFPSGTTEVVRLEP